MKWYSKYITVYGKPFHEIPQELIAEVRSRFAQKQNDEKPLVTISIIAYNEEKHLFACLWSLSNMICHFPVEFIGVDNDSTDNTAEIFKACGINYFTEHKHSCGFARLCGLNHAQGTYHINIDSDTLYPPLYVEQMVKALTKPHVVAASSSWSYLPDKNHAKWSLFFYETTRDLYLWLQSYQRPELSVRGLVFGYKTHLAKKVGIRTDIIRGEDGSLALNLKQFGKIHFIRNRKARAITGYGTVGADGSFFNSFKKRAVKSIRNLGNLFTKKTYYKDDDQNLVNHK